MDLVRFDIGPELRQALEPLIFDALFEYAARHRKSVDEPMHLSVTQSLEVLAAQEARWRDKLGKDCRALGLIASPFTRKHASLLHDMLRAAHEFFRRDGAHTFRACSALDSSDERFSILWADYFSRGLLDWLRDHDLINDPDQLDVADLLVEGAKLWVKDLSGHVPHDADPTSFFLDADREVNVTFERGPVKLKLRGKPEPVLLRPHGQGIELREYKLGESEHAELRIVQAVLYMAVVSRSRGMLCDAGSVQFFRARPVQAHCDDLEVDDAFDSFVGNRPVIHRLKLKLSAARKSTPPQMQESWLVTGPPGGGKTELVRCAARALGLPLIELHSASISNVEDLVRAANESLEDSELKPEITTDAHDRAILTYPPCVLFFDDAHGLKRRFDALHSLFAPERKLIALHGDALFPHSIIFAAAAEHSKVPEYLHATFRHLDIDPYRADEVARMVQHAFEERGLLLSDELALLLAQMGRCNPLRARLFASELRDRHNSNPAATPLTRDSVMQLANLNWKVDERGLSAKDYHYLQALESGPKGLPALQHLLPTLGDELLVHIEPYLIQLGAVHRSPRGRSLTVLGEQLLHRHRVASRD